MALVQCKVCDKVISKKAVSCPNCGEPVKKKSSFFTFIVTLFSVFIAFGYFSENSKPNNSNVAKRTLSVKEIALEKVKFDYSWNKTGFDNIIMKANFIILNESQYQIKDIEITCNHYTKNGTRIDSNDRIIFDIIPANTQKSFDGINMGFIHTQAEETACSITDLKV